MTAMIFRAFPLASKSARVALRSSSYAHSSGVSCSGSSGGRNPRPASIPYGGIAILLLCMFKGLVVCYRSTTLFKAEGQGSWHGACFWVHYL